MEKILICDDDRDFLDLLTIYLQSRKYDFFMTHEGGRIIPALKQNKIKLLLMDLNLSDMYGKEIIDQIRNDPELKKTHIVLMTGSPLTKYEADRLGVNGILEKPFEFPKLEEIIKNN